MPAIAPSTGPQISATCSRSSPLSRAAALSSCGAATASRSRKSRTAGSIAKLTSPSPAQRVERGGSLRTVPTSGARPRAEVMAPSRRPSPAVAVRSTNQIERDAILTRYLRCVRQPSAQRQRRGRCFPHDSNDADRLIRGLIGGQAAAAVEIMGRAQTCQDPMVVTAAALIGPGAPELLARWSRAGSDIPRASSRRDRHRVSGRRP